MLFHLLDWIRNLALSIQRVYPVPLKQRILQNGANPDPVSFTPGADIVFVSDVCDPGTGMLLLVDPNPSDDCFAENGFDTDFPPGIVDLFPCP